MGGRITGEGHEDNVFPAALLYLPAGGDAPGVGIEDDLEQDGGIIGGGAGIVVAVAVIEEGKIEFLVDQVVQRVLEGAGEDLLIKGDGDEFALAVVVLFVACHRMPPQSRGSCLDLDGIVYDNQKLWERFFYRLNVLVTCAAAGKRGS